MPQDPPPGAAGQPPGGAPVGPVQPGTPTAPGAPTGPGGAAPPSGRGGPDIVQWGEPEPARQPSFAARLGRLGGDRRLGFMLAGLGGLALFGSLVAEWQATVMPADYFGGVNPSGTETVRLATTLGDLAAWGTGYLTGVLLLVAMTALLLFGASAHRRTARILVLSTAGVLLAMLVAVGLELDAESVPVGGYPMPEARAQPQVSVGRGLTCAFAGVIALALAAQLSVRAMADAPRPRSQPASPANIPLDLTVEPTAPFTGFVDRPHERS